MITLKGRQVVLGTLERAHCRQLWEQYEAAEPLPTEPLNPGLSAEGADAWFEEMQARQGKEQLYLGIFTAQDELVGSVQLANIDWRQRSATAGLGISRRADRGQGYGRDALATILRYGFDHLDLWRVTARIIEHNDAAQRVLEACGFVQEGREREAIYSQGRRWDQLIYGLLRDELVREVRAPPG